jgi:hypothetical protein
MSNGMADHTMAKMVQIKTWVISVIFLISHVQRKDMITTNETYIWSSVKQTLCYARFLHVNSATGHIRLFHKIVLLISFLCTWLIKNMTEITQVFIWTILAIVWSAILRFRASDYPFDCFVRFVLRNLLGFLCNVLTLDQGLPFCSCSHYNVCPFIYSFWLPQLIPS